MRGLRPLLALLLLLFVPRWAPALGAQGPEGAPGRLDRGRFTAVYYPQDERLARALLDGALARDTFPGLARPAARVLLAIAPDARRFRAWVGAGAPEWGAAIAFPAQGRIVMHGSRAGGDAGDPSEVFRHELAHLALHERLGDLPPRWFDEGYAAWAAAEWGREEVLATNVALLLRGPPTLARLDSGFYGGAGEAGASYALAYRAVAELAALDPARGLTLFFGYWKQTGSLDKAVRAAYGLTLGGFEERYQQRTRRRYGALAAAGDLTAVGVLFSLLLLPLYVSRRRRDRRRLALMLEADRAAEARQAVIDELLRTLPLPEPASGGETGASDHAAGPDEIPPMDAGGGSSGKT